MWVLPESRGWSKGKTDGAEAVSHNHKEREVKDQWWTDEVGAQN